MRVGYTTGVFDLFHIGHVNLLRNARSLCDRLVVGVSTDGLVECKRQRPIIPYHERIEVVRACEYVDVAIPQFDMNKVEAVRKLHASVLFVGDDWYQNESWDEYEGALKELSCDIVYFPYTQGTSSTIINQTLEDLRKKSAS